MAKEQKAIVKLLNGNDLINFYRFSIKNKTKIINNIVELYATSLSMLKDDLKDFDKFMIFETDSYGNVIDTIFECDSSEFLDMIKEFYKDYYGRYPSEDKYDSERWGYIVSGHKNYKESRKYARKSLKEGIDVKIVYWDDTPTDYLDDVTRNDIVDLENDANVYKIIDVTNGKKKTIYLAESKKGKKNSLKEKKFNPNDYFYELWELNGKKYKDWTVFEWKDIEDDFFKAYATWGKTFFSMFSGNSDSNSLVNNGKLMSVLDKNGVQLTGKELNEIAYELNELIRNYKKTESKKFTRKSLREFKGIETIDGKNKESDGNDYYEIALNLKTNEIVRIKNASCSAVAEKMVCEYFNVPCNAMTYKTIKIFFMGTSPNLDLNRIPKKYHKYFNDIQ